MSSRNRLLRAFRNGGPCVNLALGNDGQWNRERANIPTCGGWYWIRSTTPIATFGGLAQPHGNHYNIPERVTYNQYLINSGIVLLPQRRDSLYVIYSGEAKNLRSRAREHRHGNVGTACLGLASYGLLRNERWLFCFVSRQDIFPYCDDDKALRVYGEQLWRSLNGWPILCKR